MRTNRNKMAVLSWVTIYPLLTLTLWASQPLTRHLPLYVSTLLISLFLTMITNYVTMPVMTRAFSRWLRQPPAAAFTRNDLAPAEPLPSAADSH